VIGPVVTAEGGAQFQGPVLGAPVTPRRGRARAGSFLFRGSRLLGPAT